MSDVRNYTNKNTQAASRKSNLFVNLHVPVFDSANSDR